MRISETHTVTISLYDEDERIVRPIAPYHSYRGRKDAMISVNHITVDLVDWTVTAEGAAVLKNGQTSGYGHRAQLTEEDQLRFAKLAGLYVNSEKTEEEQEDDRVFLENRRTQIESIINLPT